MAKDNIHDVNSWTAKTQEAGGRELVLEMEKKIVALAILSRLSIEEIESEAERMSMRMKERIGVLIILHHTPWENPRLSSPLFVTDSTSWRDLEKHPVRPFAYWRESPISATLMNANCEQTHVSGSPKLPTQFTYAKRNLEVTNWVIYRLLKERIGVFLWKVS